MKKIVNYILLGVLILTSYIIYDSISLISKNKEESVYCGVIVGKNTLQERKSKYSTEEQPYLIINFDELGKKAIRVSANDYFTHTENERVCYYLSHREAYGKDKYEIGFIRIVLFSISILAAAIILIHLLCELVDWITEYFRM